MLSFFVFLHVLLCSLSADPHIVNTIHKNNDDKLQIEFIDISGELNNYVDFDKTEVIAESFEFIDGAIYINIPNPHLLFTEMSTNTIWQYDIIRNTLSKIKIINEYNDCGPTSIGWNKNFPNELWLTCFINGNILQIDIETLEIIHSYDHKTYHIQKYTKFEPKDIIITNNGDVYFSDMPLSRNSESGSRGGIYHINPRNGEIILIKLMMIGSNGIALRNDEKLLIAAKSSHFKQNDWRNVNILGFTTKSKRQYTDDLFSEFFPFFESHIQPFYDYLLHSQYDMIFNGNLFDNNNNLWQSMFFNNAENGGQISIIRNNGNSIVEAQYIGTIRIKNTIYSPTNLAMDHNQGYMYMTCKAALIRVKVKTSVTPKKTEL